MNFAIRVLVVDDNQLFCEAATALLNREHQIEVVGSATSKNHAIRIARSTPADVALIGPNLVKEEAVRLIEMMKGEVPELRIVASGVAADRESILDVIEAGANDYLLRNQPSSDLVRCIIDVGKGHPKQTRARLALLLKRKGNLPLPLNGKRVAMTGPWLTGRQVEILHLMAGGRTNKEIATDLGIALSTVKNHVHQILNRFGVESREEAVRSGYRSGILS